MKIGFIGIGQMGAGMAALEAVVFENGGILASLGKGAVIARLAARDAGLPAKRPAT